MAIVELIYDVKPLSYIASNPTKVLSNGEPIYYTNGQYSIGDGTTQLSALPLYGGTSGGTWGSITGTLSSQTDLQTALNNKLDASQKSTSADQVVITNGSNILTSLSLGASQSIRRNSTNTAFEAYTPTDTFTLQLSHAPNSSAFAANNIRYWSNIFFDTSAPRSTAGQQLIRLPFNATVKSAVITTWNASGGVSQTNSTVFLRINGVDNTLSSAVLWSSSAATPVNNQITGLNIPITTSDSFEIKIQMGNLTTAPTSAAVCSVTLYLEK